jgi:hypothetical protein
MKYTPKIVTSNTGIFFFVLCFAILFLYACSNSGGSDGAGTEKTGAISFDMRFDDPTSDQKVALSATAASPSGDVCVDYEIISIAVDVVDSLNFPVASDSWGCWLHYGKIEDVPVGTGMSLIGEAITESGKVAWRGEIHGITITSDPEPTNAGILELVYVGNDSDLPYVVKTVPDNLAVDAPLDTIIVVTFSEKMCAASVNNSTFKCKDGRTDEQISGSIEFDEEKRIFSLTPDTILSPSSTYLCTISKEVEDIAAHEMGVDYEWNFFTKELSSWYKDNDGDGYSDGVSQESPTRPDPNWYLAGELISIAGDCKDDDSDINPGAAEICNDELDNDCDSEIDCFDEDCIGIPPCDKTWFKDSDGDEYSDGTSQESPTKPGDIWYLAEELTATFGDCNDDDADINPGAAEICNDELDNDCDSKIDCEDEDCNGIPPCDNIWFKDSDGDGYSDGTSQESPTKPGDIWYLAEELTATFGDCNDDDADINPGAPEKCNDDFDNDCDSEIDCEDEDCIGIPPCNRTWYKDSDGDGYSDGTSQESPNRPDDIWYLAGELEAISGDCNDEDDSIHPGADEILCDFIDQDCDGNDYCIFDFEDVTPTYVFNLSQLDRPGKITKSLSVTKNKVRIDIVRENSSDDGQENDEKFDMTDVFGNVRIDPFVNPDAPNSEFIVNFIDPETERPMPVSRVSVTMGDFNGRVGDEKNPIEDDDLILQAYEDNNARPKEYHIAEDRDSLKDLGKDNPYGWNYEILSVTAPNSMCIRSIRMNGSAAGILFSGNSVFYDDIIVEGPCIEAPQY